MSSNVFCPMQPKILIFIMIMNNNVWVSVIIGQVVLYYSHLLPNLRYSSITMYAFLCCVLHPVSIIKGVEHHNHSMKILRSFHLNTSFTIKGTGAKGCNNLALVFKTSFLAVTYRNTHTPCVHACVHAHTHTLCVQIH